MTSTKENFIFIFTWFTRILINFLAAFGVILIIYTLIYLHYNQPWPPLESVSVFLSSLLTLIATFLMTISIYFYKSDYNPPEKISVYITAPIVSMTCLYAIITLIIKGSLPLNIVNGFAILAISGALFRTQKNPNKDERFFFKGFKKIS